MEMQNEIQFSPKVGEMLDFKKFDFINEQIENDLFQSIFIDEDNESVAIILESEFKTFLLSKNYKEKIKNISLKQIEDGTWLTGDSELDEVLEDAIVILNKTEQGLQTCLGYKVTLSKKIKI